MREVENIPYAASFMESTRAIGYSFSTAIADIIDNSVFARATMIDINFDAYVKTPYLYILDDGIGMSNKELFEAMRYGAKSPSSIRDKNDLGRFGLGMKTASLSQCRKLTVVSKKENDLSCMIWDLDIVKKTGKWSMLEVEPLEISTSNIMGVKELLKLNSGTLVLWENLDRVGENEPNFKDVFEKKIANLKEHLALVFHRYIGGDARKFVLRMNGNIIQAIDPFLTSNFATQKKPSQVFMINNTPIKIQPYILPYIKKMTNDDIKTLGGKDNLRQKQGFYIYRNKRLIIWGKWFGQYPKHELQKLVRVQIDIPNSLDYIWDIDVKKSQAVLPPIIKRDLGLMLNKVLIEGKNIFGFRGRTKNIKQDVEYLWNRIENRGALNYKINTNHPLIISLYKEFDNDRLLNNIFELIGNYLPYNQIYNDLADNKDIDVGDKERDNLEKVRKLFKLLENNQIKSILTNDRKIEVFNLTNEEKEILKGEFLNEYN